jgi:hypothetical protein
MLKSPLVGELLALAVLSCNVVTPAAAASSNDADAFDWIIPKICADGRNKPVSVDPLHGCPAGTHLRAIEPGDPLPYRKIDNPKQQIKDIYPRIAPDGTKYAVVTFDFLDPKNEGSSRFKVWEDGYDAYVVKDGWASGSETRMGGTGGEYATTFFGAGCKNYGGLIFFPTSFLKSLQSPGNTKPSIAGAAWEEDDQPYPGACPTHYETDQIFTWSLARNFSFSGIGGAPSKSLDTIIATMGLRTSKDPKIMADWMSYGHLEVFYFTKLYGLTRWESWIPEEQFAHDGREPAAQTQERATNVAKVCSPGVGTASSYKLANGQPALRYTMTYQGHSFTMKDCRDWTNIQVENPPIQPPVWPVSGLNLLKNFHFNGPTLNPLPNWDTSHLSHAELKVSKAKDDTTHDTPTPLKGIAYLRLGCRSGCNAELIHQDIPVSSATPSGSYVLGVVARTEAGTGSLKVTLAQMDGNGADLSKTGFTAHNLSPDKTSCDNAGQHCRTYAFDPNANTGSIGLSTDFVSETLPITIDPRARKLRFEIAPESANDFDIVSAWLMVNP